NIGYKDLSPDSPSVPNKNNSTWQSFLLQFNSILKQYDLDICSYKKTHMGDASFLIGWAKNYEETEVLDFVDTTIQTGVLAPTGEQQNPNKVFSLPHGYNGHVGIPLIFDMAFGFYEWLTCAVHADTLILLQSTKELRMKTAYEQSGFIKLAKGNAKICPGLIANVGGYVQADHFAGGLSLTVGYSFAYQSDTTIEPCDTSLFNKNIVNSDEQYKSWKRNTLHLKAEYDFTKKDTRFGPRLAIFYNWHLTGKRTFKTNTGGASFGLDIALKM
ncbi:hypothetical protein KAH94_05460, partial [bacterium]|nr:hypothetical protein [bacterium]